MALQALQSILAAFAADQRGNIAIMAALTLPVLLGTTGLGVEVAYWYVTQRDMQNAADSAAIAAATNGTTTYVAEAKAVAAVYGFVDGKNNVSVVASNAETCPAGSPITGAKCYSVRITGYVPLFLSQVVGYRGTDAGLTLTGDSAARRQVLSAVAVVAPEALPRKYCVLSLGSNGVTFEANGAPKAAMEGCSLMSNGSATCNGGNLGADYGDAAGTNKGCGVVQRSNVAPLADPYEKLWAASADTELKTNPCPTLFPGRTPLYPQTPRRNNDPDVPPENQWPVGVQQNLTGTRIKHICGGLQLTGSTTGTVVVNSHPEGTVLVIWNGDLDLGPHTLTTSSGSSLTIVFAGDNGYGHTLRGTGKIDITAPASGPWKGVALYQVKTTASGALLESDVDISAAGNSPSWSITGLVYLPNSTVTFSGAVNKSSYGESCFVLVVKEITINGTGAILEHGDCNRAGLEMPTGSSATSRGRLVA